MMTFIIRSAASLVLSAFIFTGASHAQSADDIACGETPAKGAFEACSRVIKAGGDPVVVARAYFNRGIAQEAKGSLKRALQDYNKAIELNPNYSPPHNNRGIIYARQGRLKQALENYNRSVELDPNNIYALNSRGRFYLVNKSDAKRALADFERAIQLNKTYSVSFANRGFAHQKLGNKVAALADFDTALKLGVTPAQKAMLVKEIKRLRR